MLYGSSSRSLVHQHHWTLSKTLLRCPADALSHEHAAVSILQDQSLYKLQQIIDRVIDRVDVRVGNKQFAGGTNWTKGYTV